jgi:uncharacterized protein involved in type VI secretion and phage assembly
MAVPTPVDGSAPGFFGVYPALVTRLVDDKNGDQKYGRVEVSFPTLGTDGNRDVRAWATLCSPYADDDQGLEILPEVGSQVVVAFEAGNPNRPYILGAAWNGKAKVPHAAEKPNNVRVLKTRSKSKLEFDDTGGAEKVTLSMDSGHTVVLDNQARSVTIRHSGGSSIEMDAAGVISIHSMLSVNVTATSVKVTAPVSTFSGIVECKTLMTDAFVVSPAYTPGVGNLL